MKAAEAISWHWPLAFPKPMCQRPQREHRATSMPNCSRPHSHGHTQTDTHETPPHPHPQGRPTSSGHWMPSSDPSPMRRCHRVPQALSAHRQYKWLRPHLDSGRASTLRRLAQGWEGAAATSSGQSQVRKRHSAQRLRTNSRATAPNGKGAAPSPTGGGGTKLAKSSVGEGERAKRAGSGRLWRAMAGPGAGRVPGTGSDTAGPGSVSALHAGPGTGAGPGIGTGEPGAGSPTADGDGGDGDVDKGDGSPTAEQVSNTSSLARAADLLRCRPEGAAVELKDGAKTG